MISTILFALSLSLINADGGGKDIYNGIQGPSRWSFEESLGATQCNGLYQSPINIEPSDEIFNKTLNGIMANDGSHPRVSWANQAGGKLINTGDSFKFQSASNDGTFTRPDGVYNMVQFHVHANSEHRVNGRTFAAEFHFVHVMQNKNGTHLAVVGAFVDFGAQSDGFTAAFVNAAKNLGANEEVSFQPNYVPVVGGLKASSKIYRYTGSLTTPPCTEGVKWHVASDVFLKISVADYNALKSRMPFNARGTMPLIYVGDPNWNTKRKSDYFNN